jgi:hypothetical protein
MATLWLATYVICIGLVCSFILFEVLDIDGSDFPAPPTSTTTPIKLAEPAHEIKRALLSSPALLWMLFSILVFVLEGSGLRPHRMPAPVTVQPGPRRRRPRLALPRASLADPAPSA